MPRVLPLRELLSIWFQGAASPAALDALEALYASARNAGRTDFTAAVKAGVRGELEKTRDKMVDDIASVDLS